MCDTHILDILVYEEARDEEFDYVFREFLSEQYIIGLDDVLGFIEEFDFMEIDEYFSLQNEIERSEVADSDRDYRIEEGLIHGV